MSIMPFSSADGVTVKVSNIFLNVASSTFASVITQKHGGKIIEKKKEQTVDMKKLQFIASLQLVESALQVCPDNVPEKIEKQFNIETERLKKLQGLGRK